MDIKFIVFISTCLLVFIIFGGYFWCKKDKKLEPYFSVKTDQDLSLLIPKTTSDIKLISAEIKKIIILDLDVFLKIKPCKRTFENTVLFFDFIRDKILSALGRIEVLKYVHPDQEMIRCSMETSADLMNFFNQELMSKKVFTAINDYSKSGEPLNKQQAYLLEKIQQDLKFSGCFLDEKDLAEFKKLENLIVIKCDEFSQNIASDDSSLLFREDELVNVSPQVLASLEQPLAVSYIVKTDYPTYFEMMKNCSVSSTRAKMYNLFLNRAYPQNDSVLREIVALRHELSKMLGFENYAELDLSSKMAGSPSKVIDFLNDVLANLGSSVSSEFKLLSKSLPASVEIGDDGLLNPWDFDYLASFYEKEFLSLDQNEVAKYFPLENTLRGIFGLYEKMLGLRFEIVSDSEKFWHEDTILIKAFNVSDNLFRGYIVLDLHPRAGKYSHACCGSILSGVSNKYHDRNPVIFVIANFQKATKNFPSLLKHDEVKTFFHEFGHAMHNLLGKTEYGYFSGTSVMTDFVEAPSQLFEEWMFSEEVLESISSHYITKKSLPHELIEKIKIQRGYSLGIWTSRQVRLALFSLRCYQDDGILSFKDLENEIISTVPSVVRPSQDVNFYASFGHLTGYGASYYSYLWSLVFAKELWKKIELLGVSSKESGDLVKSLLSAGGMIHPDELLYSVLGSAPSAKAFEDFLNKK